MAELARKRVMISSFAVPTRYGDASLDRPPDIMKFGWQAKHKTGPVVGTKASQCTEVQAYIGERATVRVQIGNPAGNGFVTKLFYDALKAHFILLRPNGRCGGRWQMRFRSLKRWPAMTRPRRHRPVESCVRCRNREPSHRFHPERLLRRDTLRQAASSCDPRSPAISSPLAARDRRPDRGLLDPLHADSVLRSCPAMD